VLPDAGGTWYHHSTDDFRRDLMADAEAWRKVKTAYSDLMDRNHKSARVPAEVRDAHAAALMASEYAYVLAAVLRVAGRDFGPETARRLAGSTDFILENGDDDDLNADVKPGTPLPPPHPREQEEAGQISIYAVLAEDAQGAA
jgi:hypothetical protein